MRDQRSRAPASVDNIYKLDGRVPVGKAIPFGLMIGAVIVGGCIEGLLGLTAKYWRRFVSPIVSACVVTTIGFSQNVGLVAMTKVVNRFTIMFGALTEDTIDSTKPE